MSTALHHIPHRTKKLPPLRVGIGGPVGSGKTTILEMLCKAMREKWDLMAITNDIYTKEDQRLLTISGALPPERIMGVELAAAPTPPFGKMPPSTWKRLTACSRTSPTTPTSCLSNPVGTTWPLPSAPAERSRPSTSWIDVAAGEKIPRKERAPASPRVTCLSSTKRTWPGPRGQTWPSCAATPSSNHTTPKGLKPFVMTNLKTLDGLE